MWRTSIPLATHQFPRSPHIFCAFCPVLSLLLLKLKGTQQPALLGPCGLWPNCCMDEDATWYGGRPRQRPRHCVRWGPSSPSKRSTAPIFVQCLLWPRLDVSTCYFIRGYRPQPRWHCIIDGTQLLQHTPPQKRGTPQLSAYVCCGQTTGWIKMPLGTEIGLVPCHIFLDGDPALLARKGAQQPDTFRPVSMLWPNGRSSQSSCLSYVVAVQLKMYVNWRKYTVWVLRQVPT